MKQYILFLIIAVLATACSSTSNLPDEEVLYTGLKSTNYNMPELTEQSYPSADLTTVTPHIENMKLELDAALASAPNASFMGSSTIKYPFPIRLWIYNAFAKSENGIGKWLRNSFGQRWVTISDVSPEVHSLAAKNILKAYGFFNGDVKYKIIESSNPKKAKIQYDIIPNNLYIVDTVARVGFPDDIDSIMEASKGEWNIHQGTPFSVSDLEAERTRLSNMLRNKGYYYYQKDYIVYTADSVSHPGKVILHISPSPDVPAEANKKWYFGHLRLQMRKTAREQLTDSINTRFFTLLYNTKRPLRPGVVLRDITFRKGELFSWDKYEESVQNIANSGLYSSTDFIFTPRPDTDTLDITVNCVFDKPYDATFEAGINGNSNSRLGPHLSLGLTKRNAFHGGELLSFNVFGDYQWQLNKQTSTNGKSQNYYVYGFSVDLEYPRIETPFNWFHQSRRRPRQRQYATPKTNFAVSYQVQNRPDYFRYITVSASVKYTIQPTATSTHEFSPLTYDYSFISGGTETFNRLLDENPSLSAYSDVCVPKMSYTYTYNSPASNPNPIRWRTTVSEASNILNLAYTIGGRKWNEKDKKFLRNPFSQFIKVETDFVKRWRMSENSRLLWHINGGLLYNYGNTEINGAPYNELFYVGGANSLRAFTSHGIGPGSLYLGDESKTLLYMMRTGTLKFETNLEYRFQIAGDLQGALFADAGNIWYFNEDYYDVEDGDYLNEMMKIDFFRQLATNVGVGLRYDLGFLVVRLDWGVAVHLPYDTEKTGYFNVDKLKNNNALHFAIGFPF